MLVAKPVSCGGWINCPVCFSEDGKLVFQAIGPNIDVLASVTGNRLYHLSGHTSNIISILLNPDNPSQIISASCGGEVYLWNFENGDCVRNIRLESEILWMGNSSLHSDTIYLILQNTSCNKRKRTDMSSSVSNKKSSWKLVEFCIKNENLKQEILRRKEKFSAACMRSYKQSSSREVVIAMVSESTLTLWIKNISNGNGEVSSHSHIRNLTSVDLHPSMSQCVTGDIKGQITVWNGIDGSTNISKTKLHWHAHAMKCLKYSNDGLLLLSGGMESVLVIWKLDSGERSFYPRLQSSLEHISASPNDSSYCILFTDNSLSHINPITMEVNWQHQGMTLSGKLSTRSLMYSGLCADPRTNDLILNGGSDAGSLQFFNISTGKETRRLMMSSRNQIPPTEENDLFRIDVKQACFSSTGYELVTMDQSTNDSSLNLKFWQFTVESCNYKLISCVDRAHIGDASSLIYHPNQDLVVSSGSDGRFKIWAKVQRGSSVSQIKGSKEGEHPLYTWVCRSEAKYRDGIPVSAIDFSGDGSVLAVCYGSNITLWDPYVSAMLHVLSCPGLDERIDQICFAKDTPFLLVRSDCGIYVWNVLTFGLWWSYQASASWIAINNISQTNNSEVVVALSDKNNSSVLVYFRIESPVPLLKVRVQCSSISSMLFLAEGEDTQLVCVGNNSEIWLVKEENLHGNSKLSLEATEHDRLAFKNFFLFANRPEKTKKTAMVSVDQSHNDIFSVPSHMMIPLTSVYRSFMDKLFVKNDSKDLKKDMASCNKYSAKESDSLFNDKGRIANHAIVVEAEKESMGFQKNKKLYSSLIADLNIRSE